MKERIKNHFKENKQIYVAATAGVIVGVAGTALVGHSNKVVNARAIQVLTWNSKQTIEVHIEALGDPGNIIQDLTTGVVYASQGQVARALGVTPSLIAKHLSGKLPSVKGHVLEKLGKAAVPE